MVMKLVALALPSDRHAAVVPSPEGQIPIRIHPLCAFKGRAKEEELAGKTSCKPTALPTTSLKSHVWHPSLRSMKAPAFKSAEYPATGMEGLKDNRAEAVRLPIRQKRQTRIIS